MDLFKFYSAESTADLEIRGAWSSRPLERGWGVVSKKTFFRPFGPQFCLKIRGTVPTGPSSCSATVYPLPCSQSLFLSLYCRVSCFRKVSNFSLDHSYLFRILVLLLLYPSFCFLIQKSIRMQGKKIFSQCFNIVRQIVGWPVIPSSWVLLESVNWIYRLYGTGNCWQRLSGVCF